MEATLTYRGTRVRILFGLVKRKEKRIVGLDENKGQLSFLSKLKPKL